MAFLALLAFMTTGVFLYRAVTIPSMSLLYSGVDPVAATSVVAALEQRGIEFEIRGSSIYVDQLERDSTRLALAGEGLPPSGIQGYELMDNLAGFGTTNQMFDATYWRAQEGELARTILATPRVKAARVHIANTSSRPFETVQNKTASVTVTLSGPGLSAEHARAIRFLVASAVYGLKPENVTVIDANSGIILAAGVSEPSDQLNEGANEEGRRLKTGIERLIEARTGAGNAVVEVSVELETESENILERRFDPESRVAISTETEETAESATGSTAGNVTVASNLPDGDTSGGDQSNSSNSITKERINYEISETTRETIRAAGKIKRISAAILVDGIVGIDASGVKTWAPRSTEEIDALTTLIKSAIGFDESRGDLVTVTSLEFPSEPDLGTLAESSAFDLFAVNGMKLIQLVVLGIIAIALGMFVVRPVLSSASPVVHLPGPVPLPEVGQLPGIRQLPNIPDEASAVDEQLSSLRGLVSERGQDSSKVLKGWIDAAPIGSGGA